MDHHNLCKGKKVANPNKCKKVRGCKVAAGPKRTYCRKAKSHRNKTAKKTTAKKTAKKSPVVNTRARRSARVYIKNTNDPLAKFRRGSMYTKRA